MIEIIKDKKTWDAFIKTFDKCDLYHTYDYHHITKSEEESPILIKYIENTKTIALPLLVRKIYDTEYLDATSVYGYPGPLSNDVLDSFDNSIFKKELKKLFYTNNVVSVFSRLNPYLPCQDVCLKSIGEISAIGNVVNIDLTLDLEEQKKAYSRRLRTHINKARKNCTIKKVETKEELLSFIEIYYENMRRVNAMKYYFFDTSYFTDLWDSNSYKKDILLAVDNETGKIIAGAMFIKKGNIVQYHLAGAREDFLNIYPLKMLIDEMRIIATKEGFHFLNLGGGVGNKEDSLFHFKAKFSKDFKEFKLWKYIVNQAVYEELVNKKETLPCRKFWNNCNDYFPCYRCDVHTRWTKNIL